MNTDARGERLSILLVEDDEACRQLVRLTLESPEVEVFEVGTGYAAIAMARRQRIDACLLDWHLPDVDGPEVVSELRRAGGGHPPAVMMLTGRTDDEARESAERAGIELYLTKPFSPIELLEAVGRLTASLRPATAGGAR